MIDPQKSDLGRPVKFREYERGDNGVTGKTVLGTLRLIDRMSVLVLVRGAERVFNRAELEFAE